VSSPWEPIQGSSWLSSSGVDVQDDDGVIVTDGERAGAKFRVNQVKRYPVGSLQVLALRTTAETFD
jgi:hypothetical protein